MSGMTRWWLAALAVVVGSSWAAGPMEPVVLNTERPSEADRPTTVAPGNWLLEGGYAYQQLEDVDIHRIGEVLLRYGLMDRLEARLGLNSYVVMEAAIGADGFENHDLGLKYRVLDQRGWVPSFGLEGRITLPTGSSRVDSNDVQAGIRGLAAWDDVLPALDLVGNLGFELESMGGNDFSQYPWAFGATYQFHRNWQTFLELYGDINTENIPNRSYIHSGFVFQHNRGVQLDAHLGFGLNGLAGDWVAGVGGAAQF